MPAWTPRTRVLLIGDVAREEFRQACNWLQAETDLTTAESCAAASAMVREAASPLPQWIVLAAPHRGCAELTGVEELHAAAPLARMVSLLGAWCEGETRSGRPLRGVARVSWLNFVPRASDAFCVLPGEADYAGWRLPRTAAPLDVFQQTRTPRISQTTSRAAIAVVAPGGEDFRALADALATIGCDATWCRDGNLPPDAEGVLWQAASLSPASRQTWAAMRESAESRPFVALLDFPRWHEAAELFELGAVTVLAKPFLLGDLRHALAATGLIDDSETFSAKVG